MMENKTEQRGYEKELTPVEKTVMNNKQVAVKEVECKSILVKSKIGDYALNCYTGCQNGCVVTPGS